MSDGNEMHAHRWSRWAGAVAAAGAATLAWTAIFFGTRVAVGRRFPVGDGSGAADGAAHLAGGLGLVLVGVVLLVALAAAVRGRLDAGRVAVVVLILLAAFGAVAVGRSHPSRCVHDAYGHDDRCTTASTARARDVVRVSGPPVAAAVALLLAGVASQRAVVARRREGWDRRSVIDLLLVLAVGAFGWYVVGLAAWQWMAFRYPIPMGGWYDSDGGATPDDFKFTAVFGIFGCGILGVGVALANRRAAELHR